MSDHNALLKRLFAFLIIIILIALAIGSFLAIRTIGRIDHVEKASEDLDSRNLRFTPRFRAQIYRLQSVALRARITGDPAHCERFDLLRSDLTQFLESQKEIFDQSEEIELYSSLRKRLNPYLLELDPGEQNGTGENEAEPLSEIQTRINGMSESLQRLGDGLASMELRWQLQRTHANLLMVNAKGTEKKLELFTESLAELRETLAETESEVAAEKRKISALKNFSAKLARFETEAEAIAIRWVKKGSTEKRFQNLEKLQDMRDEVIEIAQSLGISRREDFKESLKEYQALVGGLQYFIFIALGMLFASLFIMGWLARLAFLKPIEVSLAEAEETVSTRENLATIGTLASGVAHEIRNPITAIKARLFALGELARKDESMVRQVDAIQSETNRMEHIVQDFLSFARPSEPNLERLSVADFLDDIHSTVTPEIQTRGLSLIMGRTVEARARIDKEQLKQVFLNLIRNAAEACPQGGEIVLSSEREGENVNLTVTDNGSGIPEEYLGRIFDPFFSKKKAGTGLGLAICRNIVETHHGQLTCESTEGEGTTFTIALEAV